MEQVSVVRELVSSQPKSSTHEIEQTTFEQLEVQSPGLLQVSVVKELVSLQSVPREHVTAAGQSPIQLEQSSLPSQAEFPQHARVGFPEASQSGSVPKQALLSQRPSQAFEQPEQNPEEQYSFPEHETGDPEQHWTQVLEFWQILVVAAKPSQPATTLEQPPKPEHELWQTASSVAEQSTSQQSCGQSL